MKLYSPKELSNPDYQEHEAISGSDLSKVFFECLAKWRYGESKSSAALEFGIVSHAMILENDVFADEFVRALDPAQYPDALFTQTDLKAWLKDRGQKVSGTKDELIDRILDTGETAQIWELLKAEHEGTSEGKTIVPFKDFDKVELMRDTIMRDETMAEMLDNGTAEHSIIGVRDGCSLANKVRPDLITRSAALVNYKTARYVHPEYFGKHCHDLGYLLKASLEWDMFTALYGQEPSAYVFLAQEKEAPYIWKPYYLTKDQLNIGRQQRDPAMRQIEAAIEQNRFPAYGSDPAPLELPAFITNKYQEQ